MGAAINGTVYLPLLTQDKLGTASKPVWGSPIIFSPRDGLVWVVNPDAGSVSALDPVRMVSDVTIFTGGEPWSLAFTPDGSKLLVVDRAGGRLVVLDMEQLSVQTSLQVGPEPGQVVVSPKGDLAYVSVTAANKLIVIDMQKLTLLRQIALPPRPYAVAVNGDGNRVYVTHLLAQASPSYTTGADDGADGLVSVLSAHGEVIEVVILPPDRHGFANQLTSISIHDERAWVPIVRAAPDKPNGLSTTVFAAISSLDLRSNREDETARLMLNDETTFGSPVNNPVAAVPSSDGRRLYVVLAGSDLIEVVDVADPSRPLLVGFLPAGRNPRGIAISPDGRYGFVMSYLARAITILDLQNMQHLAEVPVVGESLDPAVLRGKILFNTVTDPRMAKSSWISCATCHADGGSDGVTWMLADGPRQTPALWNAADTLPWHWSAALDEPHDVEDSIHILQFGLGLAPGEDPPLLGRPNAGRSTDLDALAAFLGHGLRAPQGLPLLGDVDRGRAVFAMSGCASCHGGPTWTTSRLTDEPGTLDPDGNGMIDAVLHDVGTSTPADVRGSGGFDIPSLLGIGMTAPYMHDGSLATLGAVIDSGHPTPGQPRARSLTPTDREALIAFLLTIDANTPPLLVP